jgi:hypothetical protein
MTTSRRQSSGAFPLVEREPLDPIDDLDLRVRRLEQGGRDTRGVTTIHDRRIHRTEQRVAWMAGAIDALCKHFGVDLEQPMPTFPDELDNGQDHDEAPVVDPNAETHPAAVAGREDTP